MSRYDLFLRSGRNGRLYGLSQYAKVFHVYSGTPAGTLRDVPTMQRLLLPFVSVGGNTGLSYSGMPRAYATSAASLGLGSERVWHALTPIFSGNIDKLEHRHDELESCVPVMCLLNYEDWTFYSSAQDVQEYTYLPARIIAGVVYE